MDKVGNALDIHPLMPDTLTVPVTEACITHPESCGPEGGTLTVWLHLTNCSEGLLFTTRSSGTTGINFGCVDEVHFR